MPLLVAAMLLWAVRYVESPESSRGRFLVFSALLLGLAISTKYTAVLASPALAFAIAAKNGPRQLRRLVLELGLAGALAIAVFAVLNPYVFIERGESAGTVLGIFNAFYRGQDSGAMAWELPRALDGVLAPLRYGPGSWAGLLLAASSVWWLFGRGEGKARLAVVMLGTFPLLTALLLFRHEVPFRYALPALPGIAVLSAWVMSRWCSDSRRGIGLVVFGVAAAV